MWDDVCFVTFVHCIPSCSIKKKSLFLCDWGEGGQGGELPELAGFSLYLESRKLGIKGKQNDWAVPRLDLSVCLIYVYDEAMACVRLHIF